MAEADGRMPAVLAATPDLISGWITVVTASMVPLLQPGDGVEVRPAVPRLGDIILVGHEGHLLLHRVLRIDDRVLWLGGDATASWEGPFPVQVWPVVVSVRRHGREAPLESRWLQRLARRGLPVLVPRRILRRVWAKALRRLAGTSAQR